MIIGQFRTPAGELVVANTHLSFVPGWGRRQLIRIRRDLSAFPDPVILMGDLNMAGRLPATITGYRPLAGHPTFPVDEPDQQLDHILLRGEFGEVQDSQRTGVAAVRPPRACRRPDRAAGGGSTRMRPVAPTGPPIAMPPGESPWRSPAAG